MLSVAEIGKGEFPADPEALESPAGHGSCFTETTHTN